jgi:hypothetical protein
MYNGYIVTKGMHAVYVVFTRRYVKNVRLVERSGVGGLFNVACNRQGHSATGKLAGANHRPTASTAKVTHMLPSGARTRRIPQLARGVHPSGTERYALPHELPRAPKIKDEPLTSEFA